MENTADMAILPSPMPYEGSEWQIVFTFSKEDLDVFAFALRLSSIGERIIPALLPSEEDQRYRYLLYETIQTEISRLASPEQTGFKRGRLQYLSSISPSSETRTGFIPLTSTDYRILVDALTRVVAVTVRPTSTSNHHYRTILTRLHMTVALPLAVLEAEHGIPALPISERKLS